MDRPNARIVACPRCGRKAERDFRFCPSCGRILDGIGSFEDVLDESFTRLDGSQDGRAGGSAALDSVARLDALSADLRVLEDELDTLAAPPSTSPRASPIMEVS